jgi:hypothetical protein
VIRQAITCDICGSEKRQTNHWFVAYEVGGELRMGGWTSRHRLRPESKHLCGQTCLHKLVDEFMAKSIAVRAQRNDDDEPALATSTDTSLTSKAAYADPVLNLNLNLGPKLDLNPESTVRMLTPVEAATAQPAPRQATGLVTMPARNNAAATIDAPDEPHFNSANWRAEAWERERERELRAAERRPDIVRRRSQK